jgi:ATP/maltotriose-dependent transcriptional regulator MalT
MADVAALAVDLAELFAGPESELVERVRFLASRGESARLLAKAIARVVPEGIHTLVLDDYQIGGSAQAVNDLVAELFDVTALGLVIGSRTKPTWAAGRRVIYGETLLLTQADLAFTEEEAAAVLPTANSVREQAKGWPAVIGLAALADHSGGLTAELPPEELYDFLATEMLGAADEDLRLALLKLAAGADVMPDVAQSLLGPGWTAIINDAVGRGFVIRDGAWISMHPLLRRFLLSRLAEVASVARERLLNDVFDALRVHAAWQASFALQTAFPRRDQAVAALEVALAPLLAAGRTATVEQWVRLMGESGFEHPIFLLARAEVALRQGDDVQAQPLAEEAARGLTGDLAAQAHITAARAAHADDQILGAAENARRAEELAGGYELRTEAVWLAFANAYERDPSRAHEALQRLKAVDDPRPEHAVRVACAESFLLMGAEGNARRALHAAKRAVALAEAIQDPLLRTNALNLMAQLLRICGEYAAALDVTPRLFEEAEVSGLAFVVDHANLAHAGALIGVRAISRAQAALRELDSRPGRASEHVKGNGALAAARLRIAAGDLRGASLALEQKVPTLPFALRGEFFAMRALVAAALGDRTAAYSWLESADSHPQYLEAAATSAMALTIAASSPSVKPDEAASAVKAALAAGCADAVVVALRAHPDLARQAVMAGAGTLLEPLLHASHDFDLGRRAGLPMHREHRRGEHLSPREEEVYELLIAGRSNQEIADTLFISQSTAKVHIKHIFEKLGVHSRAEAVAVALKNNR